MSGNIWHCQCLVRSNQESEHSLTFTGANESLRFPLSFSSQMQHLVLHVPDGLPSIISVRVLRMHIHCGHVPVLFTNL